jgi:hypothetical protein
MVFCFPLVAIGILFCFIKIKTWIEWFLLGIQVFLIVFKIYSEVRIKYTFSTAKNTLVRVCLGLLLILIFAFSIADLIHKE